MLVESYTILVDESTRIEESNFRISIKTERSNLESLFNKLSELEDPLSFSLFELLGISVLIV